MPKKQTQLRSESTSQTLLISTRIPIGVQSFAKDAAKIRVTCGVDAICKCICIPAHCHLFPFLPLRAVAPRRGCCTGHRIIRRVYGRETLRTDAAIEFTLDMPSLKYLARRNPAGLWVGRRYTASLFVADSAIRTDAHTLSIEGPRRLQCIHVRH